MYIQCTVNSSIPVAHLSLSSPTYPVQVEVGIRMVYTKCAKHILAVQKGLGNLTLKLTLTLQH